MSRQYFGAHQQAYPSHGDQNPIGLKAVAAAIRYQGNAYNAERSLTQEVPAPTAAVTQTQDEEA